MVGNMPTPAAHARHSSETALKISVSYPQHNPRCESYEVERRAAVRKTAEEGGSREQTPGSSMGRRASSWEDIQEEEEEGT